jgi:hypothetical protein
MLLEGMCDYIAAGTGNDDHSKQFGCQNKQKCLLALSAKYRSYRGSISIALKQVNKTKTLSRDFVNGRVFTPLS